MKRKIIESIGSGADPEFEVRLGARYGRGTSRHMRPTVGRGQNPDGGFWILDIL